MKGLIFLLIITQGLALAEDSDFGPIPDFMYENQKVTAGDDLIEIKEVAYERNKKASFCTRPIEMVDTIVLHHSETRSTETPEDINAYHLIRGSATDPWYMIAYSYVLNSPYIGNSTPQAQAFYGRPLHIVGAHAGTSVFVPMDEVQSKLWADKKIKCGKENETPVYDPTVVQKGKIKANVTTIGVVIIGNYSEFSGEYIRDPKNRKKVIKNKNPNLNGSAPAQEPSSVLIDQFARLSCQLQKQYPRMKTLAYHNQYHSTSCPGTIQEKDNMLKIQTKAKEYGCEFSILPRKYY